MEEEKWINKGHVRAFLVCDKSFLESDAPFVQWLRKKDLGLAGAKDTTPTVRGCISTSHVNCMRMVCRG